MILEKSLLSFLLQLSVKVEVDDSSDHGHAHTHDSGGGILHEGVDHQSKVDDDGQDNGEHATPNLVGTRLVGHLLTQVSMIPTMQVSGTEAARLIIRRSLMLPVRHLSRLRCLLWLERAM